MQNLRRSASRLSIRGGGAFIPLSKDRYKMVFNSAHEDKFNGDYYNNDKSSSRPCLGELSMRFNNYLLEEYLLLRGADSLRMEEAALRVCGKRTKDDSMLVEQVERKIIPKQIFEPFMLQNSQSKKPVKKYQSGDDEDIYTLSNPSRVVYYLVDAPDDFILEEVVTKSRFGTDLRPALSYRKTNIHDLCRELDPDTFDEVMITLHDIEDAYKIFRREMEEESSDSE